MIAKVHASMALLLALGCAGAPPPDAASPTSGEAEPSSTQSTTPATTASVFVVDQVDDFDAFEAFLARTEARRKELGVRGKLVSRAEDGYYWITGRVDDVLNVSGHRLGTAEIESALVSHDAVAEAAVVGFPHDIKGTGIYAFVDVIPEYRDADREELIGALQEHVRHEIGPIARPDLIQVAAGLPKTRSGKIMRRILRKIAAGEVDDLGDVSTLADPSVVGALVEDRQRPA
jgi:acetyl-CoA synthetase